MITFTYILIVNTRFHAAPMNHKSSIILLIIFCTPCIANAGWLGPNNYWECILKNMRGVQSDTVAEEVILSCKNDYPFHERIFIEKKQPWFGPKSASSCVLKYGKKVRSEVGARYLQSACYKLYPNDE